MAQRPCPGGGGGAKALPFRIGTEACPIFLGLKILSRVIFLDLVFCLLKFMFLGSHLPENLYFGINSLAHNKDELNEKILNGRFSRSFCLSYRNVEHWNMNNLYPCMGISCLRLLPKIIFLAPTVKSPLPKLVSTDPPGRPWVNSVLLALYAFHDPIDFILCVISTQLKETHEQMSSLI